MRKIISQTSKEGKEARNRRIMVIIVAVIMLFSVIGYSFKGFSSDEVERKNYGGIEFQLTERGWYFSIQGLEFIMQYLPEDTMNISTNITLDTQSYVNSPLYFSTDSLPEGIREIEGNLYNIVPRMQYACLDENCTEYAIKNCSEDNIIIIKEYNETFISQEDNCITIYTINDEVIRASDRFLYKIFGFN
jgi:hypothetical protein